jgi:predicted DNA-binding ribbon-helix-helix protein
LDSGQSPLLSLDLPAKDNHENKMLNFNSAARISIPQWLSQEKQSKACG